MQGRAPHAARQARNGLGSASRPAYSSLLQKAAAHTACRRVMRLQAGLSGRPLYLAAVQGRVPRGSPSPRRPRLGHPACLYSSPRCKAAAQTTYRRMTRFRAGLPAGPYLAGVQGCASYAARQARAAPAGLSGRPLPYRESKAECHAARQARGSGLATRPAYIARYDARLLPMHATYRRWCGSGLASRPALTLPECKAARFTRLARLDAAQARAPRPAYSALRMRGRCPGSFPPRDAALGWPLGRPLPCWIARTRVSDSPSSMQLRLGLLARAHSAPRSKAAARADDVQPNAARLSAAALVCCSSCSYSST